MIEDHPEWSRRKLSIALCEAWNWRNARNELKDMASRTLMLKLHERGLIKLPERRQVPSNRMTDRIIVPVEHDTDPIEQNLKCLKKLTITLVSKGHTEETLYNHLLSTYHYLGYTSSVGENLKYLVKDTKNRILACLLFGSSAWSCHDRDAYIGWSKEQRQDHLSLTTNNTRFLILPWVRVPHLASHILGLICKRIATDWYARYGHYVYLLETFVDQSRFQGTCYKAANWLCVGKTQGRSRNDRYSQMSVPIKYVYLYPLEKHFRETLTKSSPVYAK